MYLRCQGKLCLRTFFRTNRPTPPRPSTPSICADTTQCTVELLLRRISTVDWLGLELSCRVCCAILPR